MSMFLYLELCSKLKSKKKQETWYRTWICYPKQKRQEQVQKPSQKWFHLDEITVISRHIPLGKNPVLNCADAYMNVSLMKNIMLKDLWAAQNTTVAAQIYNSGIRMFDKAPCVRGESDVNTPQIDGIRKCSKTSFTIRKASKSTK